MQVDRGIQCLGPLPKRVECAVVEILPVGVPVDHGAAKLKLARATFELVGRGAGILHRQMREARIVVGAFDDFARQKVVRFACPATRGLHVRLGLDSGPGYGQHATVDAGGIHGAQAHLTEIGQAFEKSFTALRRQVDDRRRPILLEPGSEEMLFDSDLL